MQRPAVRLRTALVALVGGFCVAAPQAASFSCTGTLTAVERMVCHDPVVSPLDEYLARYHQSARLKLRHAGDCLRSDQQAWLREVRNACVDVACLKRAYLERLAVLDGLQPGASVLNNVVLPPVPALVWIVPPAADQVAAPRVKGLRPLLARGRLLNEVATGDGWVLVDAEGRKRVMVTAMFFDDSTEGLNALVGLPNTVYQVRGQQEGASAHFAQSACRFVYRLPD